MGVRPLNEVVTSLPTDQGVPGSIPGSTVRFLSNENCSMACMDWVFTQFVLILSYAVSVRGSMHSVDHDQGTPANYTRVLNVLLICNFLPYRTPACKSLVIMIVKPIRSSRFIFAEFGRILK